MSSERKDVLSDLPDPILHYILSFLKTKEAFQTSILSTRWKNLPNHLPTLKLSVEHFKSIESFNKSVSQILSQRDDSTVLHSLDFINPHALDFTHRQDYVEYDILKSIVEYAVSHHVQQLQICITCDIQQFPPCLFSSQTLTSLQLWVHSRIGHRNIFPNSLNLPSLTNLSLADFYFCGGDDDGCAEPFSALNKLNTLTIMYCSVLKARILCISSTTLVSLTTFGYYYDYNYNGQFELQICAPSLCNFAFTGSANQKLCVSYPCSVKHLYIDASVTNADGLFEEDAAVLLSWLQELANIKSLTVSSNTLQVLSFVPDLFKVKLSLCNLESLKVEMKPPPRGLDWITRYPAFVDEDEDLQVYLKREPYLPIIPDGVVDFLLQNSPSAKVNIITING